MGTWLERGLPPRSAGDGLDLVMHSRPGQLVEFMERPGLSPREHAAKSFPAGSGEHGAADAQLTRLRGAVQVPHHDAICADILTMRAAV
jgi:hypothetical protein